MKIKESGEEKTLESTEVEMEKLLEKFYYSFVSKEEEEQMESDVIVAVDSFRNLFAIASKYQSTEIALVECIMMDSTAFGSRNCVVMGPNNTIKSAKEFFKGDDHRQIHYLSVNGLPSGTSKLVCWAKYDDSKMREILGEIYFGGSILKTARIFQDKFGGPETKQQEEDNFPYSKYIEKSKNGKKLLVSTPARNFEFIKEIKMLNGKWLPMDLKWEVNVLNEEEVKKLVKRFFGSKSYVLTLKQNLEENCNSVYVAGFIVATAYGRDSGAKFNSSDEECIEVISGRKASGGSVKNWTTKVFEGTKVLLKNVSENILELINTEEWEVQELNK